MRVLRENRVSQSNVAMNTGDVNRRSKAGRKSGDDFTDIVTKGRSITSVKSCEGGGSSLSAKAWDSCSISGFPEDPGQASLPRTHLAELGVRVAEEGYWQERIVRPRSYN